jgi:hypothetical protein
MKLRAKWHGLTFVETRSGTIALQKAQRVNEEINAPEVRLVGWTASNWES